jgi:hypothetical protein
VWGSEAGFYIDGNNVVHGYLRGPTGEIKPFDPPGEGPQGLGCYADCQLGLNDFGAVTGLYLDSNNIYRGFLRAADGRFTTFAAPGADTTPGSFNGTFPVSINDWGVITGYYIDKNTVLHAFLLIP